MKYAGFISYSHKFDIPLARALHDELHRFNKPWNKLRALRIYRDERSLSANAALWPTIVEALERSEHLLLFASTEAAKSEWVSKELSWWIENRPLEKLLIVLTAGAIKWDSEAQDFDWSVTTALPNFLRGRFKHEPKYVAADWVRRENAGEEIAFPTQDPRFRVALLDIAAPLHNRDKDELAGADVETLRRNQSIARRAIVVLVLLLLVAAGALAGVAWQYREAQHQLGVSYFEKGRELSVTGHPMSALPYLVEALDIGINGPAIQTMLGAIQPIPAKMFVQGGSILSVDFAPDSKHIVSAGRDFKAYVVDAQTGLAIAPPLQHRDDINAAAFSPDGHMVVTVSSDNTARVWSALTGEPVTLPLEHGEIVSSAAFSADGKYVVTRTDDDHLHVWDVRSHKHVSQPIEHFGIVTADSIDVERQRIVTVGHDEAQIRALDTGAVLARFEHAQIRFAAFDHNGTHVLSASHDGSAIVWDVVGGGSQALRPGHAAEITGAAFSADGSKVVTASEDRTARIWDAVTAHPLTAPLRHHGPVTSAAFDGSSERVVTRSENNVQVWHASTGRPLTPPLEHRGGIRAVSLSNDGMHVASASEDNAIRIWDLVDVPPPPPPLEHETIVLAAVFSRDAEHVHTMEVKPSPAGTRTMSHVWRALTGERLKTQVYPALIEKGGVDDRHARMLTSDRVGSVELWDLETGHQLLTIEQTSQVELAAFDSSGTLFATAGDDRVVRVWDAQTGRAASPQLEHEQPVYALAFDPQHSRIATATKDGALQVWSIPGGALVTRNVRAATPASHIVFDAQGQHFATSSDEAGARVWDAATAQPVTPRLDHEGTAVFTVAFNPDGTRLLTGGVDAKARVWDAVSGAPLTLPLVHESQLMAAEFSADGATIITGSFDGVARLWDSGTGQPLTPELVHKGRLMSGALSQDGTRLLTTSADNQAKVFRAQVWLLTRDAHSVGAWKAAARCAPCTLVNGVLANNVQDHSVQCGLR